MVWPWFPFISYRTASGLCTVINCIWQKAILSIYDITGHVEQVISRLTNQLVLMVNSTTFDAYSVEIFRNTLGVLMNVYSEIGFEVFRLIGLNHRAREAARCEVNTSDICHAHVDITFVELKGDLVEFLQGKSPLDMIFITTVIVIRIWTRRVAHRQ